jgi:hypothetical protein
MDFFFETSQGLFLIFSLRKKSSSVAMLSGLSNEVLSRQYLQLVVSVEKV